MHVLIYVLTIYSHHLVLSHELVKEGTSTSMISSNIGVISFLFFRAWLTLYIQYYTCADPGGLDLN